MTREETMTTTDDKQKEKIKTPFAKVIVDGRGANSYFSILYFDPTDKDFHIGYSSYYLNYVFNWLNEEFEIVEDGNSTLTALRPVSREQVEKVWRGEWKHYLRADLARVTAERDAAKPPEVLEAVDELVEFARTRMCIADWLYYVEVLGEWRGDDMVVEQNWVDHEGIEGPEGKEG